MKAVIFNLFETLVTEWVSDKYTKEMAAKDLGADDDESMPFPEAQKPSDVVQFAKRMEREQGI